MGTKEDHLSKASLPQLHMGEAALLGLRGASHPFLTLGTDGVQGHGQESRSCTHLPGATLYSLTL